MLIKLEYLFSGEVAKPLSQTVLILKPRVVSVGVFHRVDFLTVVKKTLLRNACFQQVYSVAYLYRTILVIAK